MLCEQLQLLQRDCCNGAVIAVLEAPLAAVAV
jgi:hypothetical protein